MTLAVASLILIMMLVTAVGTLSYFQKQYKTTLTTHQVGMVELLADSIDATITSAQSALQGNAKVFPADIANDPQKIQQWLENRTGLKTQFFTNHLMMFDQNGSVVALTPLSHDISHAEQHIQKIIGQTFTTGAPQISAPMPCCNNPKELQMIFTAPVIVNGAKKLVLAGSFNMNRPNFLSHFLHVKIGHNGSIRLINREHRVILHSDQSRVHHVAVDGLSSAIDQAFAEQTPVNLRHTDAYNRDVITSLVLLKQAEILVASSYQVSEAYAAANSARNLFIWVTLLGMLVAFVVILLMMRMLTRPLTTLASHVSSLPEKSGDERFIHLPVNGEIGNLTNAFNKMVQDLESQTSALVASEQRYRIVTEFTSDFTFWRLPDGNFEFLSPSCYELTGYKREELYKNPDLIEQIVHPDDLEEASKTVAAIPPEQADQDIELEYRIVTKDGTERWIRHTCRSVIDENGNFLGKRGCWCDISEHKQLAEQVNHMVQHDLLTGLPNRSMFTNCLHQLTAHKLEQRMAIVLFLGIDRFKLINDTLGHEVGDQLLVMVAERLRKLLQSGDTLSRFGGDVFAFILPGRDSRHEAVTIAYRILECLENPFNARGQQVALSGSIGIALYPQDGEDPESLQKNAETAMYDAKRNGKNCFRFYAREMNAQAAYMLQLDSSMSASLYNNDFFLQYQPQLDLYENEIVAVEALLRWRHPELGMIPPDRFIPLAEESGFIIKLGEWVLRTACKQCAEWQQTGLAPLRVAVNVSGRQFAEPDFVDLVTDALAESGLPSDLLELELTESLLVTNAHQALQKLQMLKQMGIQLAVDDFGTGYSSLAYLKHFPLDRLKVDKSFIDEILTNQDDAAIAEAIIAMARALKLKVIAEGVETAEQLAFLEQRGCNEIQGYFLSKPLTDPDLRSFVSTRREEG